MRASAIACLLLLFGAVCAPAQDFKPPQISSTSVDWDAARATLDGLGSAPDVDTLAYLNHATGSVFPNIAASPVPVLLPFDRDALLQRKAGEQSGFLTDFGKPKFFLAGPAGYDAAFSITLPESDTRSKPRAVEVHISGFAFLYELEARMGGEEKPLAGLQAEFSDMRRLYLESHMRYLFTRYGVLYDVSIECYEGNSRRLSCQEAHPVVARFLKTLNIAGGTPQSLVASAAPMPEARPEKNSTIFSYHPPGKLISGTDSRRRGGDVDYTVFAPIRFPLADAPAQAYSQMYINIGDCTAELGDSRTVRRYGAPFRCAPGKQIAAADMPNGGQNMYPWRDNFCESRSLFVGQCPSGFGHQGQDLVPVGCALSSRDNDECGRGNHRVVAVHEGTVLRSPRQEGLVVVANAPGTHVRFRYLHMNPKAVDADGFFSGRVVQEGEIIGKVSNFNGREGGTSYHLHFDMQVPTKDGWVLVNPYMTLVSSYERLLGGRGMEIQEEITRIPDSDIVQTASVPSESKAPRKNIRKSTRKKRFAAYHKRHK